MLTSEELQALGPAERTQLFDSLVHERYDTHEAACQGLDVPRATYFRWRRDHTVPLVYIMLLQAWREVDGEIAARLRRELRVVATLQAKTAAALEALIKSLSLAAPHES